RVDGGQRSVGKGLSFLFLLFTVYCSLVDVFTGCASSKRVELPKTHATAIELSQRGVEAFDAGNYDMALIAFQKSLQLNTSVDNQNGICINLLNLGRLYLAIGRFDDAKPVLERAVKIGFNLNDPLIISEAYATLGRYYYLTGNNKDAMDNLEKAVLIDSKEGYRTIGSKLNILGMVYKDSNRLEEAEKAFHDALKANQNYGLEAATADSFRGLGDVFLEKGDYKKAGESYKNALSIDKKSANSAKISLGLFSVGMSSLKENDAQIALDFFLRAYEVDSSRGDNKRALKTLDEIIGIYHELGDKNSMEKYLLERERLLQKETSLRKEGVGQK
ncbi:MAG: tetratricopeptide repeat protein, partial [Deltaproteobacteria bacterium]|nr:tetratricopeptide repeat protein [Deltaproteobacteria bacterium]